MLAGVMSRCSTPRRCIPATARASLPASRISSSTASGLASPARVVSPASASTIDPGYRGASTSCATPSTPRSRSRIATSCRSRRCASGPSGSLRITGAPGKDQPSHPRACALMQQHLGPSGRIPARRHPSVPIRHLRDAIYA